MTFPKTTRKSHRKSTSFWRLLDWILKMRGLNYGFHKKYFRKNINFWWLFLVFLGFWQKTQGKAIETWCLFGVFWIEFWRWGGYRPLLLCLWVQIEIPAKVDLPQLDEFEVGIGKMENAQCTSVQNPSWVCKKMHISVDIRTYFCLATCLQHVTKYCTADGRATDINFRQARLRATH